MKFYKILGLYLFTIFIGFSSCNLENSEAGISESLLDEDSEDLLNNVSALNGKFINAVIEIPSGTIQKWELNKENGKIEWEKKNGKNRIINYLGYPGNYGFIPQTYLPIEQGGDGDPLDVIVLGPPAKRGSVVSCKLIGVIYLMDRGEQDDKLIAISEDSPFNSINSIEDLETNYNGVLDILKLWFENYKGEGKMKINGIGSQNDAEKVLNNALVAFKNNT